MYNHLITGDYFIVACLAQPSSSSGLLFLQDTNLSLKMGRYVRGAVTSIGVILNVFGLGRVAMPFDVLSYRFPVSRIFPDDREASLWSLPCRGMLVLQHYLELHTATTCI